MKWEVVNATMNIEQCFKGNRALPGQPRLAQYLTFKQGVSPLMKSSFNKMQGKIGKKKQKDIERKHDEMISPRLEYLAAVLNLCCHTLN